jgi:hypothetical protein
MNPTYNAPGWANSWQYYDNTLGATWLFANYSY